MNQIQELSEETQKYTEPERSADWVQRVLSIFDRGIFGLFNKSLTAKFLLVMATVFVLLQFASIYINVCGSQQALKKSITDRIARLAHIAAGAVSTHIATSDYKELDPYLTEILRDQDVVMVKVLAEKDNLLVAKKSPAHTGTEAGSPSLISRILNGTEEHRAAAIVGDKKVGTIVVSWSNTTLNTSLLKTAFRTIVTQTMVFLGIGFIMALFFRIDVKGPVETINGAVERITNGDLTVTINVRSRNEIGSIATGITYLTERLSRTIGNLNRTVHATASAVDGVGLAYDELKRGAADQSQSVKEIASLLNQSKQKQNAITKSVSSLSDIFTQNLSSLTQLKFSGEEIASSSRIIKETTEEAVSAVQQVHVSSAVIAEHSQSTLQYATDLSSSSGFSQKVQIFSEKMQTFHKR